MPSCPLEDPRMGDLSHMPHNAGEKFMSRYVDEENSALFPFGLGTELHAIQLHEADR